MHPSNHKTKKLYNGGPTFSTLVQHYIDGIQIFWVLIKQLEKRLLAAKWQGLENDIYIVC